jgi:ankyrin repeat protein
MFVHTRSAITQDDINDFVWAVGEFNTFTPEDIQTAVLTRGIPVNARRSVDGWTALHYAVHRQRRELVVALLAVGADPNVKNNSGMTSVWEGADWSTADILQLLIDSDGNVNEPNNYGQTPLMALVMCSDVDGAAARLEVLLACPDLNLDATYHGKTPEEWAVYMGHPQLADAIAVERRRRMQWSARAFWINATATY